MDQPTQLGDLPTQDLIQRFDEVSEHMRNIPKLDEVMGRKVDEAEEGDNHDRKKPARPDSSNNPALFDDEDIISNGSQGQVNQHVFVCANCSRLYKPYKQKKEDAHRKDSLINNQKCGTRQRGREKSRRTSTKKSLTEGEYCKFRLWLEWDSQGFYIPLKKGNTEHTFHPKVDSSCIRISTRLMSSAEKQLLQDLGEACAGAGVGRNLYETKFGRHITKCQVAYVQGCLPSSDKKGEHKEYRILDDGSKMSYIDCVLDFFKGRKDVKHQVLWDIPSEDNDPSSGKVDSRLVTTFHGENEDKYIDHTHDPDMLEHREIGLNHRISDPDCGRSTKVFLALAYATVKEIRLLKLFPEVIHCDATMDTSDDKLPLLTLSTRTPTGKQVVFLRIWIPNQRRGTFKWVFKHILPEFLPKSYHPYVKFFMVDGDPQQYNEIVASIKNNFVNARWGNCGFHVVTQSWKRHGPSSTSVPTHLQQEFKERCDVVKKWCYTWMMEGFVEDEEEYILSKAMLFAYIRSEDFLKSAGGNKDLPKRIEAFVRERVITHEENILYYKRKQVRHFNVSTNSAHEGTNLGLKKHSAPVRANHKLDNAAKVLTLQATLKMSAIDSEAHDLCLKKKCWSDLPTSSHLVPIAESILLEQMQRLKFYTVTRVEYDEFEVLFTAKHPPTQTPRPIPIFRRTRKVKFRYHENSPYCQCSCLQFERTGIPCVHIGAVLNVSNSLWLGFSYTDISPRWWSAYLRYGLDCSKDLSILMVKLFRCEIKGPLYYAKKVPPLPIMECLPPLQVYERVQNFSLQEVMFLVRLDLPM